MVNKTIRIILIFALIFSTTACYSTKIILPEEITVKQRQPIDHVILQNGKRVNLENGFIKDGNIYGDVIRTISLQSIVEAYDKKGNIITSAALAFQSQRNNFKRYLDQIERAKLATGETVNFLKVKDYKDGIITVLAERESKLFTSDEIFSTPYKPKRLSIDTVILKDGRRIVLRDGFIMNGKVYEKKMVLRHIPLKSIVEAYDKKGKVISVKDIASHADRKDFIKYTSGIVKMKLDTYEVLNFEKIIGCENGEMIVLMEEGNALFSLNEIATAEVEVFDGLKTTGAVIGVAAIVFCVGLLQFALNPPKYSCPFIYSFDREKFVLDAEPFGGSICEAMKRTDICLLEYSYLVDDKYVYRVTNERDEIQYLDEFNLYVIDHQQQYTVAPDSKGNFHLIEKPLQPEQILINDQRDDHALIINDDQQYWSSDLAYKSGLNMSDLRDEIVMTFPKPKNSIKCNLIVKGCNTDWSSRILMKIIELAGKNSTQFTNPGFLEQIKWGFVERREELFHLRAQVWSGDNWYEGGTISGGGSAIAETQVVPLDLKEIKTDYLKIRINPPAGFWKFDWIAVDYTNNPIEEIKEVRAVYAEGADKKDISESVKANDKKYYIMSRMGDEAVVMFDAPPVKRGLIRSVFAKVSGYYIPNIKGSEVACTNILDRIVNEPGFIVKFLLKEYTESNKELMAKVANH